MFAKLLQQKPLLTIPQILVLLAVLAALYIALDLNSRAQVGQLVGVGEESLQAQVVVESTRQIELQATLAYVQSDDYVSAYARDEGGQLLSGEKRVVPLFIEATPAPTPTAEATVDPSLYAQPWQAWWRLLTDAPLPTR